MDYLNKNYTSHIYLDALSHHTWMSQTKLTATDLRRDTFLQMATLF